MTIIEALKIHNTLSKIAEPSISNIKAQFASEFNVPQNFTLVDLKGLPDYEKAASSLAIIIIEEIFTEK